MAEEYGRRLLPSILHHEARGHPQRLFALVARSKNVEDGFDRVTYSQIANAANYVTKWLLENFENGQPPSCHPTLAYLGPNDLRYNILFYGAIQCRYKVFLPSPRNPISVNVSLFEQTDCVRLVHAAETVHLAVDLRQALDPARLKCTQLPSLRQLLDAPHSDYQYDLKYADVYAEPILILHSSGSTGLPKPVVSTHGTFATIDVRDWPTVPGRRNLEFATTFRFSEPESLMYDVFPPFHLAGFTVRVIVPLINGLVPIVDHPSRPPTGALVASTIRSCRPRGLYLPPVIIEQLYQEPDREDIFNERDIVFYAGGPLSHETGSQISKWTTLCQFYGSTEMGQVRQLEPLPGNWAYLEFHPHETLELQPVDERGNLHELVIFTSEQLEKTSAIYHNYPYLTEWRTKDIFEPHPTQPNLWKFYARLDDILVFSSGEKLNPIPLELQLSTVPGVKGALVVGTRYAQPALLLELTNDHAFTHPAADLWPSINAANALLPDQGRITRSMIMTTTPDKPFVRAPKGTVVRRLTEELYANEIQHLHETSQNAISAPVVSFKPSLFRDEDVRSLLRSVLSQVAIRFRVDDDDNLYEYGLDSVKTVELVNALKAALLLYKAEEKLGWLSLETVYLHPTINKLSRILLAFLNKDEIPLKLDSVKEMKAKMTAYTSDLLGRLSAKATKQEPQSERKGIAITGTTGFFGQQLLSKLVQCPEISSIYCLNRSPTAQDQFQKLELNHDTRLVFLRIDISSPTLGLHQDDYALVSNNCSLFLHNAWTVDFNLPLELFDVHLRGLCNVITLCAASSLHPRLVLVSSIASAGIWVPAGCPARRVPEEAVDMTGVATGMDIGYAQSKCVAEHVLASLSLDLGIPTTILRLGHILPATEGGVWPPNDILALFLQTSKTSGMLATDFLDTITWLPADNAAKIVSEIVQARLLINDDAARMEVLNVVNRQERTWSSVIDVLARWCGEQVRRIPMKDWMEELYRIDHRNSTAVSRLPALRILRLLDLWKKRGPMHQYATEQVAAISKTIHALTAPGDELIEQWLQCL